MLSPAFDTCSVKKKGDSSPSFSFSLFQVCLKFCLLSPLPSLLLSLVFELSCLSFCSRISLRQEMSCTLFCFSLFLCPPVGDASSFPPFPHSSQIISSIIVTKGSPLLRFFFSFQSFFHDCRSLCYSLSSSFWFLLRFLSPFSTDREDRSREKYMSLFLGISFLLHHQEVRVFGLRKESGSKEIKGNLSHFRARDNHSLFRIK